MGLSREAEHGPFARLGVHGLVDQTRDRRLGAIQKGVGLSGEKRNGAVHERSCIVQDLGGGPVRDLGVDLFDLQDLLHGGREGRLVQNPLVEPPRRRSHEPAEHPHAGRGDDPEGPHAGVGRDQVWGEQ